MDFIKMHGIGNDYVYVNDLDERITNPEAVSLFVSDRHFGIGSDGLILIRPSNRADFMMRMYNADGSQGAMCGNGIRCFSKFVYDEGLTIKETLTVETKSGIKTIELKKVDDEVTGARVAMEKPILKTKDIPMVWAEEECINQSLQVDGKIYQITAVSMGNPHVVVFVKNTKEIEIEKIGPSFEHHEVFPKQVNTEFIRIIDNKTIEMRVWERGSGETLACGTGACAAVVAAYLNGHTGRKVTVKLLGGDLSIEWDEKTGVIYMSGSATTVYKGTIDLKGVEV
ncbi:diaminopimelate epimerase [Carnobacterium iners]|uniref:Diaminopimelate epimerase n=1 Tax=Carnobacterium iners TaxID=1073423 RepID=A0A1X7MX65_9LACT|nr:diaminopimelate epimerase [Carnobacterium iners]SEL10374.1 diaminopimelate epimerase [Carnobacterium iners]SMH28785.1 diaminopimelate epimerase [Carnobacterium iners]